MKEKSIKTSKLHIEFKESNGEFHTKGPIATTHIDSVDDKIMVDTLYIWADKINTEGTPTSYHHKMDDPNLVGKGTKATVEKLDDGEYGLFVDTKYNKTHPDYKDIHYQIEEGFLTNYSIEYDTEDSKTTHNEYIDGRKIRVIEPETYLGGYGLTNMRKAANKDAKLYKEIMTIKKQEGENKMPKEKKEDEKPAEEAEKPKEEAKAPAEEKEEKPAEKEEDKKEEPKEEKELKEEVKTEVKELSVKELVAKEVKELMKEKPLLQDNKEKKMEVKEIKDFCDKVLKAPEVKERGTMDLSSGWARTDALHYHLHNKTGGKLASEGKTLPYQCVGTRIELKAADGGLIIPDNYSGAQTDWTSIYSAYEEYPAELGAVYQPMIINQLNDSVSTWNLLDKVDYSTQSTITFRARWARNTDVAGYTETNANTTMTNLDFDGQQSRMKCHQIFSYYKADVSVSGPMMKFAAAQGGVGDVYSDEVRYGTVDLIKKMNQEILSTGDGTAENACLGFEHLMIKTGNLFAKARATYTTLQSGGHDDMSSAPITIKKMRAMIRTVLQNGANKADLIFICDHLQEDFVKGLIQDMQGIVPTSGVVGFTGIISLDGVPIFADVDCSADDLFLVNRSHTKIGISQPPVYEELGKDGDSRRGIIKSYFNLYCTAPNQNYWIYGLATS